MNLEQFAIFCVFYAITYAIGFYRGLRQGREMRE